MQHNSRDSAVKLIQQLPKWDIAKPTLSHNYFTSQLEKYADMAVKIKVCRLLALN